jgi:hypothetical protein
MNKHLKISIAEMQQLDSLGKVFKQGWLRLHLLEQLMQPRLKVHVWRELMRRVELDEIQRFKAKYTNIDGQKAVFPGVAWKTRYGRMEYSWDKADDGKKQPKRTIPIVIVEDLITGAPKMPPYLVFAAEIMLGIDSSVAAETQVERFIDRLIHWESVAIQHMKPRTYSRKVLNLLKPKICPANPDQMSDEYDKAKLQLLSEEEGVRQNRHNPTAYRLAYELFETCTLIRNLFEAIPSDSEACFGAMNASANAECLLVRLNQAVPKGNVVRRLKQLEHKGPPLVSFSECVRKACEHCYRRNPKRSPYPKEVLEVMPAKVVWFSGNGTGPHEKRIDPIDRNDTPWKLATVEAFYAAKKSWARKRGVRCDVQNKTPGWGRLPEPTEVVTC